MLRRWLAGWSLRTRLVVTLVALLAVVSLAIGGITTAALREFLISRVDEQLLPMTGMRGGPSGNPDRAPRPGPRFGCRADSRPAPSTPGSSTDR